MEKQAKILPCRCGNVAPTIEKCEYDGYGAICNDCYDGGHDNYDDGPSDQMYTSGVSYNEAVIAWNELVLEQLEGEASEAAEADLQACPVWQAYDQALKDQKAEYERQTKVRFTVKMPWGMEPAGSMTRDTAPSEGDEITYRYHGRTFTRKVLAVVVTEPKHVTVEVEYTP